MARHTYRIAAEFIFSMNSLKDRIGQDLFIVAVDDIGRDDKIYSVLIELYRILLVNDECVNVTDFFCIVIHF